MGVASHEPVCVWYLGLCSVPSFEPSCEGRSWLHPQLHLGNNLAKVLFGSVCSWGPLQRSTLPTFWTFSTLKSANLLKMNIWSCHSSVKPVNGFPFPSGQSWKPLSWPINVFMMTQPSPPASFPATRPPLPLLWSSAFELLPSSGFLTLGSCQSLPPTSPTVFLLAPSHFLREVLTDWMPQLYPSAEPLLFLHYLIKNPLRYWPNNQTTQAKKKSFLNKDTNPMITVLFTSVSPGLVQWCSTNITEWMNECFLSSSINFKINLCWDYVIIFLSLPRVLPRGFWLTDWSNLELWSH